MIGWSKFSTNQKHYPDRASNTSSVWNLSAVRFSDVISLGNRRWRRREMSAVFSGYRSGRSHAMLPAPTGVDREHCIHCIGSDSGPSGCKGDHPHTKWLVFFSLFLTHSFLFFFFFDILFFFMPLNGKVKYFRWDTLSSYFVLQVTAAYIIGVVTMDNSKCPFFFAVRHRPNVELFMRWTKL